MCDVTSTRVAPTPQVWARKGWPAACGGPKQGGVFVQWDSVAPLAGGGGAGEPGAVTRLAWFLPVHADKSKGCVLVALYDALSSSGQLRWVGVGVLGGASSARAHGLGVRRRLSWLPRWARHCWAPREARAFAARWRPAHLPCNAEP
jgi:hypothetical protein